MSWHQSELEDVVQEIEDARRELTLKEAAPLDHRVVDEKTYRKSLHRLRARVQELKAEEQRLLGGC